MNRLPGETPDALHRPPLNSPLNSPLNPPRNPSSSRFDPAPLLVALGLCALLLALAALGEPARQALRYDRLAILQGQAWRLLTGHVVHLGWMHALLNAAGVLMCCLFAPGQFAPARAGLLAAKLAVLALGVSLLLLAFSPELANYVGLSGVLYGLYLLGLAPAARAGDRWSASALVVLLGWTLWQQFTGPSPDEERLIGGRIVTHAHLYGLLTASLWLAVAAGLAALARPQRRTADRPDI